MDGSVDPRFADRPGSAGAGAPGVAGVPAGTPMQIPIEVVLNYSDPTRSVTGSDLGPQFPATDTVRWPDETNCCTSLIDIERVVTGVCAGTRAMGPDAVPIEGPAGGRDPFELTVAGPLHLY